MEERWNAGWHGARKGYQNRLGRFQSDCVDQFWGNTFFAADYDNGSALWKTDGTEAGTVKVKDLSISVLGSYPLTVVAGTLYFAASGDSNGSELWKSDGTAAGTVQVKDIRAGGASSYPRNLTAVGSTVYFRADDGANGIELWRSNGTVAGTVRVKDINPGMGNSYPHYLTNVGGTVYFTAADNNNDFELWKSNGTEAGTVRVKNIIAGSSGSHPSYLTNVNGVLFFSADDGTNGPELWKSNGSEAGTVLVKDLSTSDPAYPSALTNVGGILYFSGWDNHGLELYISDGTAPGTVPLTNNIPVNLVYGSMASVGADVYFAARDSAHGQELWKTNGTEAGTVRLKEIRPGGDSSIPQQLINVQGTLFFTANDGVHGRELWRIVEFSNSAPTVASPIADVSVDGDSTQSVIELSNTFADVDIALYGDVLTLAVTGNTNPGQVNTSLVGTTLTLNYPSNQSITATITVRATDLNGAWVEDVFTIALTNVPPTIATPIADVTVNENDSPTVLNLSATFADANLIAGDVLSLSITSNSNPSLVTASLVGTTLTLTYAAEQHGSATVKVRATDLAGTWVEDTFIVTVNSVDTSPILTPIGNQVIGEAWSMVVSATDEDALDTLTFSLGPGAPVGMTISPGPGTRQATIHWNAGDNVLVSPNPRSITVIVTDNSTSLLSDSETIELTVVNTAPTAGVSGPQMTRTGVSQTFTLVATDPAAPDQAAGFTFDIDWDGNGTFDESTIGVSGTQISHAFSTAGNLIGVRATDKDGGLSSVFHLPVYVWRLAQVGANVEWEGSIGDDVVEFEQTGADAVQARVLQVGGFTVNVTEDFSGITGRIIAKGNAGHDLLNAASLNTIPATIEGGFDNDTIIGGGAGDILRGEYVGAKGPGAQGSDSITGGGGNDLIEGDGLEGGKDTIRGGTGDDTIYGDGGDGLEGRADSIYGDDGIDVLYGNHGHDYIEAGNGEFNYLSGGDGAESNDTLVGGAGSDLLSGQNGNDSLIGGGEPDVLLGGDGADTLTGGGSEDILVADITNFDAGLMTTALEILDEWWGGAVGEGRGYAERIAKLTGEAGGFNDGIYLVPGTTVFDDEDVDVLTGGPTDLDWFVYNLLQDVLNDHEPSETETDTAGFLPP